MSTELLKNVVVRVSTSNESGTTTGSGILIKNQSKEYFVLTAGHCIHGKKGKIFEDICVSDISVKHKRNNEDDFRDIEVTQIAYLDLDSVNKSDYQDIALLKVENLNGYACNVVNASFIGDLNKEMLNFRGFPKWINQEMKESKTFDCTIDDDDVTKFIVKSDEIKDISLGRQISETSNGISGSGVFMIKGEVLFLLGIVTDLRDEKGTFGHLVCRKIDDLAQRFQFNTEHIKSGLHNLYKWKEVNKKHIDEKIEELKKTNNEHFENLQRKCRVLYEPDDVNEMIFDLLESFFIAEINLKKLYKINPILEQNIENAQIDLKKRVKRVFNKRNVNNKEEAQDIYNQVINIYVALVKGDNNDDTPQSTIERSSDKAVTKLLMNCDLDFIQI